MASASQRLLEMEPGRPDRAVAMMLADKCIALTVSPFRFAINHDIRPPKNLACPLGYTWTRKDKCGIELKSTHLMRQWLTKAFLCGYTVYLINDRRESIGPPHSIEIARRRAENHQRPKLENDDDIPF